MSFTFVELTFFISLVHQAICNFMNTTQKNIKNNKKVRVFIIFLLLSLFFWLLIKLSSQYIGTTKVSIVYKDLPKNKLLQTETMTELTIRTKSVGFNLLRNKLRNKKLNVSLKKIQRKKGNIYYYLTDELIPILKEEFAKSDVISVKPDTLFFDFGKSISKKLKVILDLDVKYTLGHNLSGELKVEPEFITVTGPEDQIDTMLNIYTKKEVLNNVNEKIDIIIPVVKNSSLKKIRYSHDEIHIIGLVEKFTERTLSTNFNIINVPSGYKITTYPKDIELVFQLGLSDFNRISNSDFKIICDFEESTRNGFNYLIPKVKAKPDFVKEVKIIPNTIEFLIEK